MALLDRAVTISGRALKAKAPFVVILRRGKRVKQLDAAAASIGREWSQSTNTNIEGLMHAAAEGGSAAVPRQQGSLSRSYQGLCVTLVASQ